MSTDTPLIDPARIELTPAQRGMWYAQSLAPDNANYQIGQYLDINGPIDSQLLRIALTKTVRDIESLHMDFWADEHGPSATSRPPEPNDDLLEIVDLRHIRNPQAAKDAALARMDQEMRTPRPMTGDDLLGTILFRLSDKSHMLFQRVHHIMLDGYSAVIALHYLARVYTELSERAPRGPLRRALYGPIARTAAKTPSPFPGHSELLDDLAKYRASDNFRVDHAFWEAQFHQETPVEGIEGTPEQPAVEVLRTAIALPAEVTAALAERERDMPRTIVGVIAVYLAKITGQHTVSLGLPVTARRGKVAKSTPSMLSTILPMRIDVPHSSTLTDTISHAGHVLRQVVTHQRFRVEELPGSPPHAGPSVNLLPTIDTLQFHRARGEVNILSTGPVHDLSVVISGVTSHAASAQIQLEGDAALHTHDGLKEHAHRMLSLLEQALFHDKRTVHAAALMTDKETQEVLDRGMGPQHTISAESILDSFTQIASTRAHETAVIAADGQFTFEQLDISSTQLAHYLIHQGVQPGDGVAVRIERSKNLPLLVLAVLKAGGVYIPLDPEYPVDRVAGMIDDSSPALLLTSCRQAAEDRRAGAPWDVQSLAVDSDTAASWHSQGTSRATLPVMGPTDLAYIIFTSGSTGRPKGVSVERIALRNLFDHHQVHLFGPAERDLGRPLRVAHTAGLSFDAAWDPLLWLFAGHQLHITDDQVRRDPSALAEYLSEHQIDSIETTPSFAEFLVSTGLFQKEHHPTVVALGGEEVGPALWDALSALQGVRAVNLYGPTEVTVNSLVTDIHHDRAPHLGASVRNSRHYILDASLRPVPDRGIGELYLAGVNVARGYVGQPRLSSERFVADPFSRDGSRMYRTGDIVRRRHNGSLRFLGRIDDQIKIRGYRVEPAEIEAAIRRQPGVAGAAVIAHGQGPAVRLVGYITSNDSGGDEVGRDVRTTLRAELPDYMVPSSIITLAELPLTPNGKLDRRSLPDPGASADDPAQQPRSATERTIAAAFAEVLGMTSIAVDEDFFGAGGHSLLATRLASELSAQLNTTITVREIFDHPTVADLAAVVTPGGDSTGRPPLVPTERPTTMPVSLAQRRLWFLHQLDPTSAAYHIPLVLHLEGELDGDALRRAMGDVVRRHESLRTIFPYVNGEPTQKTLEENHPVTFTWVSVPHHRLDAVIDAESTRPFDITTQPPLRVTLLQVDEDQHVLLATMHHIATDGWSLAPFARDLSHAYSARVSGSSPEYAPLPVTYADYTLWQRELLGTPEEPTDALQDQTAFWQRTLEDAPEEIRLPRDRIRKTSGSTGTDQPSVGDVPLDLCAEEHAAIQRLAEEHRTSIFMVLHAATAVALEQQGAGEDILIGTPVAGRSEPAVEDLVGFFVNTLTLRTSLKNDPTLAEVLARVRESNTAAYAHQDLPFDAVVEAVSPPRVADRHPLFQVMLSLQSAPPAEPHFENLRVDVPPQRTSTGVKTDLLIDFHAPSGNQGPLKAGISFDASLFDAVTVEQIRDALHRVLTAFCRTPEARLSTLPTLDTSSYREMERNSSGLHAPVHGTVMDWLASTAASYSEHVALHDANGAVTYGQLHAQVERTATGLKALGISTGDRVAVALPRSAEAVIMLLGVLRARAVAVPVDVAHPDQHIGQILRESETSLLVMTDSVRADEILSRVDSWQRTPRLRTPEQVTDTAAGEPPDLPSADETAYLVYTSGTTGTPKGVQVPHSALHNVLSHHYRTLVGPAQEQTAPRLPRMLHVSGFGFDAAWDPILWLVAGTTLHIADVDTQVNAEAVVAVVRHHGIDALETTPSYAQQLVSTGLLQHTQSRDAPFILAIGGEAVPASLWDTLAGHHGVNAWNLYGPSEFTVDSVMTQITHGAVSIGAPINNVTARVLDAKLRPVPAGVEGELYLSGASEAHGYRGMSVETAARFIADPFENGSRMYRTGDVVRRRRDGSLEFMRRNDDQVKLRGYRIEKEAVEKALESIPGLDQAMVRIVTPGGPDTARLSAWVTLEAGGTTHLTPRDVKALLSAKVPHYMVPHSIIPIDDVPLTANGKVDFKALPDQETEVPTRAADTEDEKLLCTVFADVLEVPEPGPDDNFFALGGHSLLAVALAGRMREELGIDLPIRAIFDTPTAAGLLAQAGRHSTTVAGSNTDQPQPHKSASTVTLRQWAAENPRGDQENIPLSAGQSRLWFLNRLDTSTAEYSVVLRLELEGDLHRGALESALNDLVARHEILRTTYPEVDGSPVQRIHEVSHKSLSETPLDISHGFDLTTELPLRAALVNTGDQRWRLELVIHHIATDGASLRPLVRDLAAAYTAHRGDASALQHPLAVQFADVARHQQTRSDDGHEHALRAWADALDGIPDELDLPADGSRPYQTAQPGDQIHFEIPADVARQVGAVASGAHASNFHAWLAGLAGYLHRIGAGDDVVIGSPSAGRTDPDVHDLIGFFVKTLPLRIDFTAESLSFRDAVDQTRSATLMALDHDHIEFEHIVETLNPERRLGRHPLFQTMLAVEQPTDVTLNLPGVNASILDSASTGHAKMDLSFTLRPRADESGVDGILEYNSALFSAQAAAGLVHRWIEFLRQASQHPSRLIRDLDVTSLPSPPISSWPSSENPVHVLETLQETVEEYGNQRALVDDSESLTFSEVEQRVRRLSRGLYLQGVRRGQTVALLLPRGVNTVAALLAVWRLGAIASPLDTELPPERIATMIRASQADVVLYGDTPPTMVDSTLTYVAVQALLTGPPVSGRIGSEQQEKPLGAWHDPVSEHQWSCDDPAYLIFTSGTTGEPKGVLVPHRALAHLLASHRSTVMPHPADRRVRMAHTTGVGFDAAMDPVLWLVSGHQLHMVTNDQRRDPHTLVELMSTHQIDAWEATPSYVSALIEQTSVTRMFDQRDHNLPFVLLLGGEVIDPGLWQWMRERPALESWNLYGPTEVGVDSLVARVEDSVTPVLGVATASTAAYVLDDALRPTPPGSVGELWLAGGQLAHGYRGRPVASAERFVADPFAADGSRMYRTGDLVAVHGSSHAGGSGIVERVVSMGRRDSQVKIRGHRVEPGEVESLLRAESDVSQAVVRPVIAAHGVVLGAWVVLHESPTSNGADVSSRLMARLRAQVPEYMVPSAVSVVESVPLTSNGKVDERALPELQAESTVGRPLSGTYEEAVGAAFAQMLSIDDVRAEDSFFERGGHSFIAQPTIRAINAALGTSLSVQSLFRASTVEGLAALAHEGSVDLSDSLRPLLPLRSTGDGPVVFAVHPASGLAWKYSTLVGSLNTSRPIMGLQVPGLLADDSAADSVESLQEWLDLYIEAMRAVQPTGPYYLMGWSFGGRLAHHLASRLQEVHEQVSLVAVLDAYPVTDSALAGFTDEDSIWRGFLDANGLSAPAEEQLDSERVLSLLQEHDNPMGEIPLHIIEQLVERFQRIGALLDQSPTPVFNGNLHVFEATEEVPEQRPTPKSWEAHVSGTVSFSTVAVRHADMLSPAALAEISPILNRLLSSPVSGHPSGGSPAPNLTTETGKRLKASTDHD